MTLTDALKLAAAILTAVTTITVGLTIIRGARNMRNPNFNMVSWFESVVFGIISIRIPDVDAIIALGLLIFLLWTLARLANEA